MATSDGGRADRVAAGRGLLLATVGLGVRLAITLISAALIEWMMRAIQAGQSALEASDSIRMFTPAGTAVATVAALAAAAGYALVGRASRNRAWSVVAIAAAVVGAGLGLVQLGLQLGDNLVTPETLRLLTVIGALSSLVEWAAMGLAARAAVRSAGLSVSVGAVAGWLAATAVDLVLGYARIGALSGWLDWGHARWLLYGLSTAAVVARMILLVAARRALGRAADAADWSPADGAAAPPSVDEPGSPAAADALGLYRAGLITHVAVASVGAIAGVVAGATGTAPGALVGILVLPELIAAGLVVVGLFRLGALPPAAIARAAGLCVLVGVVIQAYATSIAWRLAAQAARAESGSWGGMSLSDLFDLARRLQALELGATAASLIGFLLIASALHSTARWLALPALGTRAVALSVGVSFIALVAGCLRLYIATARHPALGVVVPAAIAAVAIGLVLFVTYVGLLGRVIERLRGAGPALPAAKLVNDGRDPAPPPA